MPALRTLSLGALALSQAALAADSTAPVAMAVPGPVADARLVGRLPAATPLTLSLSLLPNRPALKAYADAVSDPRSPDYHRFLDPATLGARFGAPQATVDAAVKFLTSKGLTVTQIGDSHMAILFKGTAGKVETAFGTTLNRYVSAAKPQGFYSFTKTPKLPAAFASKVVSIGGLQNAYPRTPLTTTLTPAQSRGLYGAASLYAGGNKGLGVTVGITNLGDGYRISNLPTFYSQFGLPAPAVGIGKNVVSVPVAGIDGNTVAEGIESNLDIQMVLAEAPSAKVVVYDGFNSDLVSINARIVQDNAVDIASESWVFRDSDDVIIAVNDQHLAMTVEGLTYMAGTGDWGADESRGNYPHAYPDVLGIGGTDATVTDANGTRGTEFGWSGSGAGWEPSNTLPFNVMPSYQIGANIPQNLNKRLFPDVSLHATGSWMVAGGSVIGVGGTSSSGPQFAGQLALLLAKLKEENAADAFGAHFRLGRLHDAIYAMDGDPSVFFDVTQGDAESFLPDGTVAQSKAGWDFVTGWGAPNVQGLHDVLFANSSVEVADDPTSAQPYTLPKPVLTLGAQPQGNVANLPEADGTTYSVLSVRQSGLGQVAAITVDVPLQTAKLRRSANVVVSMRSPELTTGYVVLLNRKTNQYDTVKTLTGNGAMSDVSIPLDVSAAGPYIGADSTVRMMVRALKPARLGNIPFRLEIDRAVVTERVPRG